MERPPITSSLDAPGGGERPEPQPGRRVPTGSEHVAEVGGSRAELTRPTTASVRDTARMSGIELLRTMFTEMVEAKDITQASRFYHPEFEMTSNGLTQGYDDFVAGHERVYATPISYAIRYDEDAWVEAEDRVAGRVWITITRPGDEPATIEVVLIATVVDGRIHRLWELTWPDWSKEPALEAYD